MVAQQSGEEMLDAIRRSGQANDRPDRRMPLEHPVARATKLAVNRTLALALGHELVPQYLILGRLGDTFRTPQTRAFSIPNRCNPAAGEGRLEHTGDLGRF